MAVTYLSLGSNIGDRVGFIQQATSLLNANENINIVSTSSFYESEPWKMNSANWFVNAVIQISTTLMPEELLAECQKIESFLGRKRQTDSYEQTSPHPSPPPIKEGSRYTDRTIDIDIISYDNLVINTPELTIPHKYFHKRAFVLVPMLEIAEDFVHPVFGKTVEELFEDIENPEMVCLYGTRI